jgi:uncharacterized protein YbjQ (UPF0145 family)
MHAVARHVTRTLEGQHMIVVTTATVAGQRIVSTLGHVLGVAVRGRTLAGNIMAGFQALGDEDATEYIELLEASHHEAIARMTAHAQQRHANAIVGTRTCVSAVGYELSEIVAYGTAVVIEPDAPEPPPYRPETDQDVAPGAERD